MFQRFSRYHIHDNTGSIDFYNNELLLLCLVSHVYTKKKCNMIFLFSSRSSRSPLLDEDDQPPPSKNIKLESKENDGLVKVCA